MKENQKTSLVLFALICVYIFWGGTYLGIKIAIETIPPFLMAGVRFILAGSMLYALSRATGASKPTLREWRGSGIVGALLLLGGNGLVGWAEQHVPSGIASLLIATVPLWILLLGWLFDGGKKPNKGVAIGVALGLVGIGVLVIQPSGGADKIDLIGVAALIVASLSWSIGSLYSRRAVQNKHPLMSTAMQMLAGGVLLSVFAYVIGDWNGFVISQVSAKSLIGFGYLVIFGSIVGYSAYVWLLKNAEPSWVSTYAFVNPIVAVLLGWQIAGETLSMSAIVAACIIIPSVVLITIYRDKN